MSIILIFTGTIDQPLFGGSVPGLGGLSSNSTCNTAGPNRLRCCHAKEYDTHLSVEARETLSLELTHGHALCDDGHGIETSPQHVIRELRHTAAVRTRNLIGGRHGSTRHLRRPRLLIAVVQTVH